MATYELTVSTNHYRDWGVKEGVSELFQNAMDGDTRGNIMSYKYIPKSNTLRVHNQGAFLNISTLLLGEGDKADDSSQIGGFGVGYKLAAIALLRMGKEFVIFNRCHPDGPQQWKGFIKHSKKYDRPTVNFRVTNINPSRDLDKLTFKIKGITPVEWEECRKRFLNSGTYGDYTAFDTPKGQILDGEKVKGCIFVGVSEDKAIFVQKNDRLHYGYNFKPGEIQLNQERNMAQSWSLEFGTSSIWNHLGKDDKHLLAIENMLGQDALDVCRLNETWCGSDDLVSKLSNRFRSKHGDNAHPVTDSANTTALGFSNIIGVPTSPLYTKVLERDIGNVDDRVKNEQESVRGTVPYAALDKDEQHVFDTAISLITKEVGNIVDVSIVTFNGDKTEGLFVDGIILVARKVLKDMGRALKVLIHEHAHSAGYDGEADFCEAERSLWAKVFVRLYNKHVTR